jgi:hypothetical protein
MQPKYLRGGRERVRRRIVDDLEALGPLGPIQADDGKASGSLGCPARDRLRGSNLAGLNAEASRSGQTRDPDAFTYTAQ